VDEEAARAGIIVGKFAHTAVDRNKLKRRLREIVRLDLLPAVTSQHVVIVARPGAYELTYSEWRRDIERTAAKARLGRAP
jgi:ribonuclease P protein component